MRRECKEELYGHRVISLLLNRVSVNVDQNIVKSSHKIDQFSIRDFEKRYKMMT